MNDRSWIVNDHNDRFHIDGDLLLSVFVQSIEPRVIVFQYLCIGDLPSDLNSVGSIPCCLPQRLTKWVSNKT